MTSRIVVPAVVIVLTVALAAGEKIKCYTCYSVGSADDSCDGEIMVKSNTHKPTECVVDSLYVFHTQILGVPALVKLADVFNVFKVDERPKKNEMDVPMACMKMNLRVNNEPVVLRSCQTAKTEQVDTCKALTNKIHQSHGQFAQVQNCSMCDTDSCNGSYALSPRMLVALVPLLGWLLMSLVYESA